MNCANILINIGLVNYNQSKFEEGLDFYKQALCIKERVKGK